VRYVETFGDQQPVVERELRDLRVRQEREFALDAVRKDRLAGIAQTVRDLVRSEDDPVAVGVPQTAHAAFGRARRIRFKVAEGEPEGCFGFGKHVGAEFVPLRVIGWRHRRETFAALRMSAPAGSVSPSLSRFG
jgi:hypothetical protein